MFAVVALRSTTVLATMESVSGDTAVDRGGDVAHIRGRKLTQQTGPYAPSHWNFVDGTEFRVSTATTPDYIHFTPGGCWKVTNDGYVEGNVPTTPGVTYVVKVELGVVYISPDVGHDGYASNSRSLKTTVGQASQTFNASALVPRSDRSLYEWVEAATFTAAANSLSTTLRFEEGDYNCMDMKDVELFAVCDASAPIANGDVGNCTSVLMHGESCTPTCDTGYGLMGERSCVDGTTVDTAACVTPVFLQRAKLTADDGPIWTKFGNSASIDGDTMVIGAWEEGSSRGSAYVFTRDTAGNLASNWTQAAKLTQDDGDGSYSNKFGWSVSIDGDTMVIGAREDNEKGSSSGSAYVFTRTTAGDLTSGWTQVAKLTADDGAAGDNFGYSVSIDSDTMVVGAWFDDNEKGSSSGSAYVFTRDTAGDLTSGWTQVAKLTADDGAVEDYFGSSVSIDGNTVVVGANGDDDNESSSGSAYVFTRTTAGDLASGWTQVAKLTAGDGAVNDYFGVSASIDGDTVVIGAHGDDDDVKGDDSGSAYVFARDTADDLTSNWTQVAKLTADDGAASDYFGWSVSIDGDTMVVGANGDNEKGSDSGSAYMFTRTTAGDLASGWTQVAKLTAGDGDAGDMFGYSVSIDGNAVVIGASSQITSSASAYVFSIHFPPCDASTPPANGAVGDCTDQLLSGSTCQPACDPGYFAPEPSVCDDGVFFPAVCVRYCDASAPPANGGVGDCVEYMLGDTTCQPTCDEGYIVSGKSSCDAAGALTAAVCRELSCCERTFDKFGFGVAYSYGDEL